MSSPSAASADAEALFEHLISLLHECPKTIEILPGNGTNWAYPQNPETVQAESSCSPFLLVEGNLGVPQKILHRVYLHAVTVFKSVRNYLHMRSMMDAQRNCDLANSPIPALIASSSILILANPSHETALSARKHLVRMRLIDLHAELQFMAALLSSQHCAKHAELWYHRRWLLSAHHDALCMAPHPRLQFPSLDALHQELDLVSRACELYPRNYFAWTHRIICMRSLLSDYLTGIDPLEFVPILRHEIAWVKGWIDRHISDYSAIHSILTLSHTALQSRDWTLIGIIVAEENPLDHAISLVQEYPAHEALWMYVRSALSISDIWQTQQTKRFVDYFVRPLAYSEISVGDDIVKASQYARQFLERKPSLEIRT